MAIGFLGYVLPFGQMSLFYLDIFNLTSLNLLTQHAPRTFIFCHFLKFYFKSLPILFNFYTPTAPAYATSLKSEDISKTNVFIDPAKAGICEPNRAFMSMFLGFIDGDGYIDVGEQTQQNKKTKLKTRSTIRLAMGIGLDARDLYVLEYFVRVLGVGSISAVPKTNKYRLYFSGKSLSSTIIPLIDKFELQFLVYNRSTQYSLLKHVINNKLKYWDQVDKSKVTPIYRSSNYLEIFNLPQFYNWFMGFTMAEGWFGFKSDKSANFSIRQSMYENLPIMEAIKYAIKEEKGTSINVDSSNSYQVTFTSRLDIQKIINIFSFSNLHPLIGYKSEQYNLWIENIRKSSRYSDLKLPLP